MLKITLLLILLSLLGGFLKGAVGFGLSFLLIGGLLGSGLPLKELFPVLVPLFIIMDISLFFENKKYIDNIEFKENFALHPSTLISLFLGLLIGAFLIKVIDADIIKLIFAIVVLILLFLLTEKVQLHQLLIPSYKMNIFFGFFTGILTGLFTINAIPLSIYLIYLQYPKNKYMGVFVTFLMISDLLLLALFLYSGFLELNGLIIALKLLSIVFVGFLLGVLLRRKISSSHFKSLVIFTLSIYSLKIIFNYFFK